MESRCENCDGSLIDVCAYGDNECLYADMIKIENLETRLAEIAEILTRILASYTEAEEMDVGEIIDDLIKAVNIAKGK